MVFAFYRNANEKITISLDCRHALQGSLIALDCAQKSLPQVEFQHISQRQISAIQHANIYLLTDMANSARYRHTKQVLEAYQTNLNSAVKWLHETFQKTLRVDLNEAENAVIEVAKQLRQERLLHMNRTVGNQMHHLH